MIRKVAIIVSSLLMIWGLVILSWGFRDLPIDERPEWMAWQMVLWPVIVLGLAEVSRLVGYVKKGWSVRADRFKIIMHGLPALVVAVAPAGTFTNLFGPQSLWSLLDFPTAKVMAAVWLAFTLWTAWEVEAL
ncbi:hypothetical protein [Sulfobacillus thermosulfidooxidans]|uniref:hypothetical protein n=1 Tax=Sulfobacillus thermosulfidooxidans TaxID=28034 RepID=UPI0006B5B331|nr:hypothetical protein [Sulfobacillus thermosulfidooxidans]